MALTKAPEELLDKSLTSALTVTVDDNSDTLTIVSTDADDAFGPFLNLHRNSSSPADNDGTGVITFAGENDNNEEIDYAQIQTASTDVSDGSEDGTFIIQTMVAGTSRDRITLSPSETAVNENSVNVDFRVESDGSANAIFVDAGNDRVGIGTNSPSTGFSVAAVLSLEPASLGAISAADSRPNLARSADGELRIAAGKDSSGFITFHVTPNGSTNVMERFKMADNITFTGRAGTSPIFSMVNSDNEDTDTGRETSLRFSGFRSGGESVDSAQISGSHDGSADDDDGQLLFYTNNGSGLNEVLSISSTGRMTTAADIVPGADVIMSNGRGISFSATTDSSGSMNSELLDDYEEGTWTPSWQPASGGQGTVTYDAGARHGTYTKIGDTVFFTVLMGQSVASSAGSGLIEIVGLPYTINSTGTFRTQSVVAHYNYDTDAGGGTGLSITLEPAQGGSKFYMLLSRKDAVWLGMQSQTFTKVGTYQYIWASGFYKV